MPELPEVETVRRGLKAILEGRRIDRVQVLRSDLRFPVPDGFGQALTGRRVKSVGRRAKFLLITLDDEAVVLSHLGMSGRFRIHFGPAPPLERHDHVVIAAGDAEIRFNDTRRFGFFDLTDTASLAHHPKLAKLGPEPLSPGLNGAWIAGRLGDRNTPIKSALLDQTIVAGLGNIYVCEALHEAGISPRRKAKAVRGQRAERLSRAIVSVLERAIAAGGSTLRDHRQPDGDLGYFQLGFTAYGREGEDCRRCGEGFPVRRIVQAGRSTFYCPRCQR